VIRKSEMEIPTQIDYENFLKEFSDELKSIKGVSFFIYGSHLRNDFVPGVSDIDGFLVLDDDFVTNKNSIKSLASSLSNALKKSNTSIKAQFNVLDKGIALDGRFLAYSRDYVDFFKKNAVRRFGKYNLENMNGFDYKNSELISISHNLHKVRQGFLYNNFNYYSNKKDFYEGDIKSPLKKLVQLPKQLINLLEGRLIEDKEESLNEFLKRFTNYSGSFVRGVNALMKDPLKYEDFLNEEGSFNFSLDCLSEMEKMIKVYVEEFPKPSEREVKDVLTN
jgi:hypothetical protein